jgi:outer membrane protein OmpA-like peptidoglycan-associated protein
MSCEKAPRIMADSKTLIFSSNRNGGKGDFDLYKSILQDDGSWSEPVNLAFVNTKNDDQFVSIPPCGDIMYFINNADIYTIPVPDNLRPNRMVTVQGFITDSITQKPVKSMVRAIQRQNQYNVEVGNNAADGRYSLMVNFGKTYNIEVAPSGYKPKQITISADKLNNCTVLNLDISLVSDSYEAKSVIIKNTKTEPIKEPVSNSGSSNFENLKKGQVITLDKIYFDQGSYVLRPISYEQLDYLVSKLKQKVRLIIEVGGHTDDVGDLRLNLALSENRAKVVANYLINKGIDEGRISHKGYGHTRPVAPNFTEPNRRKNRRVEFVVVAE